MKRAWLLWSLTLANNGIGSGCADSLPPCPRASHDLRGAPHVMRRSPPASHLQLVNFLLTPPPSDRPCVGARQPVEAEPVVLADRATPLL